MRVKPKNRTKSRPHAEWLTVNMNWKEIQSEPNTITGYASTWGGPDEHGDIVVRGAFKKTIKEKVNRHGIPLLDSHNYDSAHVLGTVVHAVEDEKGLKITARLSNTPLAQEIKQKMVEGHLSKLSIGFDTVKQRFGKDKESGKTVRYFEELKLYEISVVSVPANFETAILSVKSLIPFQDLPLADLDAEWKPDEARGRVQKEFGGEGNINFNRYRKAFLKQDAEQPTELKGYEYQIADIIDGKLVAIPNAIISAAEDIAEKERILDEVKKQISKYYEKMRDEFDYDSLFPSWEIDRKGDFDYTDEPEPEQEPEQEPEPQQEPEGKDKNNGAEPEPEHVQPSLTQKAKAVALRMKMMELQKRESETNV